MTTRFSYRAARSLYPLGHFLACAVAVVLFTFNAGMANTSQASELRRTPIVRAVEKARPSVVNIHGRKAASSGAHVGAQTGPRLVNGMGTGIVIDSRGYIITNYHVVEGVSRIQVTLHNKRSVVAKLVAHDPKTDLAIIKIPADHKLPVITLGTSSDLMQGEPVVAVGNAFGYEHTVTCGIISALHRTVPVNDNHKYFDLIQTDASINPGNSGGPLLNIDGEMIGINVAVRVGAQGIGFAIPIDKAMDSAARLLSLRSERLSGLSHGIIGKTGSQQGKPQFVVQRIRKDSPADKGGLQENDIIETAGDTTIHRPLDFERVMLGRQLGEEIELSIKRDGKPITLSLVVAPRNGTTPAIADNRVWQTLGMQFESIPKQTFRRYNSRYRGGLKIVAVRADGPAASQGVKRGDVLVGMHIWETVSPENVTYILGRSDFLKLQPVKFYILRNNETLFGHMTVSAGNSNIIK